jgi:hypothetical protein
VYLYHRETIVEKDRAVWEQYLNQYGKVTQCNTGGNTKSNTGDIAEILASNGLFVTSVTFFRESNNNSDTHRVMLLKNGKPIITKTFRNQSNKSLSLRVVGGEDLYLTLYLQGDARFEWHSKTSVTSVDAKVTNWLKSFQSDDSYAYVRDDNPANPNEWEIDLGFRTITHNTMSTPRFRTSTYKDKIEVTEEDCRWYWQQMRENRDGKYSGDWDYLENSLAYMVQGLYRKHGRPCTILMADDGGTAKKDLSIALWNIIPGVTRNSLDKIELGKRGCIALFNSSVLIADDCVWQLKKLACSSRKVYRGYAQIGGILVTFRGAFSCNVSIFFLIVTHAFRYAPLDCHPPCPFRRTHFQASRLQAFRLEFSHHSKSCCESRPRQLSSPSRE